jgi:excisionase family DNA binding protein
MRRTPPEPKLPQYLTVRQVARALALDVGAVRNACRRGLIPSIRTPGDRAYRIPSGWLEFPFAKGRK